MMDLVGKGNKMPSWAEAAVDIWCHVAKMTEIPVFRSIRCGSYLQPRATTAQAIFNVVTVYSARVGVNRVQHTLRRILAKLAHKGSSPLDQLQLSLGHSSMQTTKRFWALTRNCIPPLVMYLAS